jgi:sulfate transport system ATP-binding protein
MGFLGEVTTLGNVQLRPHDVEVSVTPGKAGAVSGRITRMLRVGFEVRLAVTAEDGSDVHVVLTRTHARTLELDEGVQVWLTPAVGATTVPSMVAV